MDYGESPYQINPHLTVTNECPNAAAWCCLAGIMGAMNARPNAVQQVIEAFRYSLAKQGWKGETAKGKLEL